MFRHNGWLCRKEDGFTFLEMLLVLSVLSVITMIVMPISANWIQQETEEDAFDAFLSSIQFIQAYAMANDVSTKMEFKHEGTMYITATSRKLEFERTNFPTGMRLSDLSPMKVIEFHPSGDMIRTGTMTIETTNGLKNIRFQFQRGRMIID
ncbi:competence type IV pilus minor pilin ComGD [Sporosarcina sp. HYO08]|uniref:competence type IV pilus minor pilin ComGD n=1 Tax=Sporosarcina sp. HYO08 TaxID=1759557 RepID=UPI00079A9734|nr:competence type IV pilus minor pilin ComGD [Sporosarcina sp. HYO08]KXH87448.1 hypothetical protein AU377_02430 [Sporosarcina sp. HYO08]